MARSHPLQNRVAPNGQIHAVADRGLRMGNRGGRIHDPQTRTLFNRRWASKQWIICELEFRDYGPRDVMGPGSYTELFFLDEVTALAAGHRPCALCRRKAFQAYQAAVASPGEREQGKVLRAPEIDAALHGERLIKPSQNLQEKAWTELPDGAMVDVDGAAYAVSGEALLQWSFAGYVSARKRPTSGQARVLTPPTSLRALTAAYLPVWHPSSLAV